LAGVAEFKSELPRDAEEKRSRPSSTASVLDQEHCGFSQRPATIYHRAARRGRKVAT